MCQIQCLAITSLAIYLHVPYICVTYFQDMLNLCKNRVVLFNNKTSNKKRHLAQLKKLLDAVDSVISSNDGYPFSNQISRIQVL